MLPWHRHLSVMSKILREVNVGPREDGRINRQRSSSLKDDIISQPDSNPDVMDYEGQPEPVPAPEPSLPEGRGSEPPPPRRTGIATINGGSVGASTPAAGSPPPVPTAPKAESPDAVSVTGGVAAAQPIPELDMNAQELCNAFERQLLELDDLAAFMGGGV